jgi:hypothetical protein
VTIPRIFLGTLLVLLGACGRRDSVSASAPLADLPQVIFWHDASDEVRRVKSVRVEIRGGFSHVDGAPVRVADLTTVLNRKLTESGLKYVMLVSDADTRFGDLVPIIAESRRCKADLILVEEQPE